MLLPSLAFTWWLMSQPTDPAGAMAPRTVAGTVAAAAGSASEPPLGLTADGAPPPPAGVACAASEGCGDRVLYRGVITPEIARVARSFLDLPMGSERFADVEGQHFVFVLQRHYPPPGFVGGPTGWHKGVTVYALR
jgi:hypothetical protein